jgi:hypothetical protein
LAGIGRRADSPDEMGLRAALSKECTFYEQSPPVPSRRDFRGLGKGQAPKTVGGGLRLAARCKECSFVSLQKPNPGSDIAGVAQITVNRELGAQEGRA